VTRAVPDEKSGCPSNSTCRCTNCCGLFCAECYEPSTCDSDEIGIKTIGHWFCDAPACVEAEAQLYGTSVDTATWEHASRRSRASWSHPGKLATETQLGQLLRLGSVAAQEAARIALDASQPRWRRLHARDSGARYAELELKCISWHHPPGHIHFHDDIPVDAVCLDLGASCPHDGERWNGCNTLQHFGVVLAIGSQHVVCSEGLHPTPAKILMLTEDRMDYIIIEAGETYGTARRPGNIL
jgi:hypothetical protein